MRTDLPDGGIGEFPDTMPDDQIEAVLRRQFSTPAASAPAPPSAPPNAPAPAAPRIPGTSITLPNIPSPMDALAKVLPTVLSPVKKAFDVAGQADVAAGRSGFPWETPKTPEQAASRAQTYTNMIPPLLTGVLKELQ